MRASGHWGFGLGHGKVNDKVEKVDRTPATGSFALTRVRGIPWFAGGFSILAIITALIGWAILQGRADARHTAAVATANLSRILADNFNSSVRQIDLGLLNIADAVSRQGNSGRLNETAIEVAIDRQNARHPDLIGFQFLGADGRLRYGSINTADTGHIARPDHFLSLAEPSDGGLVVGPAEFGRNPRQWRIAVSRRVNQADGSFAGIAICSLSAQALTESYARLDLGRHGTVALADTEFTLAAQFPEYDRPDDPGVSSKVASPFLEVIAAGAPFTQFDYASAVDGRRRLATVRKIEGQPYYLLVGLAEDDYLADWRRNAVWFLLLGALLSGMLLAAIFTLRRHLDSSEAAARAVRESEARFRRMLDEMPIGVCLVDEQGRMYFRNQRFISLFGYLEADVPDLAEWWQMACPESGYRQWAQDRWQASVSEAAAGVKDIEPVEYRVRCKNGGTRDIEIAGVTFGRHFLATFFDQSERRQAEEALRESKLFVQGVLDSVSNHIAVIDETGKIIATNNAWRQFSLENSPEPGRLAPNTDVGTNYLQVCADPASSTSAEGAAARDGIRAVLDGRLPTFSLEYPCHSPQQQRWFMMTVTPLGAGQKAAVVVHSNITERKRIEEEIRNLAYYDSLTQLPNRRMLHDRLARTLAASRRSGRHGALLLLDLDNFKPLNDQQGHAVGDLLLIEVARRLGANVREIDTVARLGGDEFVVVLGGLDASEAASRDDAMAVAEKIRSALAQPYSLTVDQEGKTAATIAHRCSSSIGVTLFVGQETNPHEIFKRADDAMYQAKQMGRNAICFR
ncbi:MAG: diguanylate cyclase [Candidatus Accumulibacter propinquus]|jgi:diguanylate cyclase (GGDEF)-like protein/PAS domain S-box-containing protein